MAGVLETFYFLFESDASKLEAGLNDANRKTDQLERNLQDTDKAAGMVGGSLMRLAGSLGAALGGMLAFGAVRATIMETASAMDDLGDEAAAFDLPIEEFSAWSMAATMMDGSQQGFIASLKSINTGIVAIATTGKGRMLPFLKEMGLSMADVETASKNPLFALEKMADTFKGLSRAEAAGLGEKLGLDQGTINLLSEGREGLAELIAKQKEMGVQTAEQTEQAGKFDLAMKEWNATFTAVKREFVTTLLPPITDFFRTLTKLVGWMSDNKPFVIAFFGSVAAVLIGKYVPAALAAARANWAMLAPYIAAGAAILAFGAIVALVADDLYAFGQGHDSVVGELAKKWPALGEAIRGTGTGLAWLLAATAAFAGLFVDLIESGPEVALANFTNAINFLVDEFSLKFPKLGLLFESLTVGMQSAIENVAAVFDWLVSKVRAGIELFAKAVSFVDGLHGAIPRALGISVEGVAPAPATVAGITKAQQSLANANTPLMSQTSSSISNSRATTSKTTTVTTGPITVQTQATDGQQVAAELGKSLKSEMRSAIDENDDGVLA
jgi:hypothetical protein